jgi:hypothetical protein
MRTGLCAALLFLNFGLLVNAVGILSGRIEQTRNSFPQPSQEGHTVFLDGTAARYYFDYHIPRGYLDFFPPLPFPLETPLEGANPNDVYVIGTEDVDFLENRRGLDYQPMAKWTPLGIPELSLYKYPRQVFVIPANLCKGLPMKTGTNDRSQ